MKKLRRISITSVHERFLLISPMGKTGSPRCPYCFARPTMISPDAAAAIAALTVRSIYRLVESGEVHFIEEPEGLFVCARSLLEQRNVTDLSMALRVSP